LLVIGLGLKANFVGFGLGMSGFGLALGFLTLALDAVVWG